MSVAQAFSGKYVLLSGILSYEWPAVPAPALTGIHPHPEH
jgi:hypothetical protein